MDEWIPAKEQIQKLLWPSVGRGKGTEEKASGDEVRTRTSR